MFYCSTHLRVVTQLCEYIVNNFNVMQRTSAKAQ